MIVSKLGILESTIFIPKLTKIAHRKADHCVILSDFFINFVPEDVFVDSEVLDYITESRYQAEFVDMMITDNFRGVHQSDNGKIKAAFYMNQFNILDNVFEYAEYFADKYFTENTRKYSTTERYFDYICFISKYGVSPSKMEYNVQDFINRIVSISEEVEGIEWETPYSGYDESREVLLFSSERKFLNVFTKTYELMQNAIAKIPTRIEAFIRIYLVENLFNTIRDHHTYSDSYIYCDWSMIDDVRDDRIGHTIDEKARDSLYQISSLASDFDIKVFSFLQLKNYNKLVLTDGFTSKGSFNKYDIVPIETWESIWTRSTYAIIIPKELKVDRGKYETAIYNRSKRYENIIKDGKSWKKGIRNYRVGK